MAEKTSIKVKILNTEEVVFEGEVERISSYNEVGRFDVFPMHANFISIIQEGLTLYKDKQLIKEIKLEKAVMKVKRDIVSIFLGIESLAFQEDEENKTETKKS